MLLLGSVEIIIENVKLLECDSFAISSSSKASTLVIWSGQVHHLNIMSLLKAKLPENAEDTRFLAQK